MQSARSTFLCVVLVLLAAPGHAKTDKVAEPGGFRMDSDPKIVTVFGDAAQYKAYVDRFFALHAQMAMAREDFSRNVQAVLATLAGHRDAAKGKSKCPTDAIALSYSRAFHLGQTYHTLGKELEARHASIKELDDLGETAGLTPDYRWKVARALKLYPQVLRDFKEMKVAFQEQLSGEIGFSGCDATVLVAKGDEQELAGAPPTAAPERPSSAKQEKKRKDEPAGEPVKAATATFFVDNTGCGSALRVFLDGVLVGEVSAKAKAAFRAPVGRHDMCLIPASSSAECGSPGTLRSSYIHDGWSIELRCD